MSAASRARAALSRLLTEAPVELKALDRHASELAAFEDALSAEDVERPVAAVVAVDLHAYYTAAETLFERIARLVDDAMPSGDGSHQALVEQMAADIPPLRPAVVSRDTATWLHSLRSFRHFFRHAYSVELDARRLAEHARALAEHHRGFREELDLAITFVRQTREALPEP